MPTNPFPYPSVATYPPPIFSGGYYPSPLPYAASFYPAPPPPGFFPATTYGPSPFFPPPPPPPAYYYPPDPNSPLPNPYSPVHAPPPESISPPTPAPVFFPAPAYGPVLPCPSYQVPAQSPESTAPPATQSSSSASATNLPASTASNFSSVEPLPVLPDHNSSSPGHSPVREDSQRLFDSLQGKLSKLRDRLSSMTTSMVPSSAASGTTAPTPSLGCTTMAASAPSLFCAEAYLSANSPSDTSTAAYVAPKVLGEMPTPSSWQGTHGTVPNYCSGQHNLIQSSCVSNLSEQNLDEMPQPYGFHSLDRQSVVLADGTKRSYFSLPADYPLEQAALPMSPSATDSVGVTAQVFVAAQAAGLATARCSKTNNIADSESLLIPNQQLPMNVQDASHVLKEMHIYDMYVEEGKACLNISSDVLDFSLELQQHHDERACNCLVIKASNSFDTRSSQLSIDRSMRELRLLWDPGASGFLVTPLTNDNSNDFFSHDRTAQWSQSEHQFIVLRGVFGEVMLDKPPAKPPDRFAIVESSLQVFLLKAQKSGNSSAYTHFNFLSCNIKQFSVVQARQDICFLLEAISSWKEGAFSLGNFAVSALWCNTTQVEDKTFGRRQTVANSHNLFSGLSRGNTENICISVKLSPWSIFLVQHILDSSMKKELIFSSGCILAGNPWSAILFLHYLFWEFSMDRVLSKTAVPHLVHRSEIPIKLLTFIEQPIALKHYMSQLLLQCHLWSQNQNAFPKVQYCCLPIVLDCLYSEPVKQLGYSSLFSSTEMCRSTTTVLMTLVWNSRKVAQEGRDEAAVYQVSKIQLPMRKISHVWELDIIFITFLPP